MNARTAAAALAVALAATAAAGAPQFKVVVHPSNPTRELTRARVSDLFLRKVTAWPTGHGAVQPVEPGEGPLHDRFCSEVHRKSPAAVRSYWIRLVFAGRDTPPVEKSTDEEVLAYVRANAGAVGYVSDGASLSGVKVVAIAE